jgi:ELWxxDGT repeat protein
VDTHAAAVARFRVDCLARPVAFSAHDGSGWGWWRSDGTAAGTRLVKRISVGEVLNVGGTVFLSADDGTLGGELWRSDGTAAGTTLVRDINPTEGSGPNALTNLDGTLLFAAHGTEGNELWKSDGTAAGTVLVRDINPTCVGSECFGSNPYMLARAGGNVFFGAAADTNGGYELWKSDGTKDGTVLAQDIKPNGGSSPLFMTNVGGRLFFSAEDGTHGRELWVLQ